MRKTTIDNPGQIHRLTIDSELLKGNTPGDPSSRTVMVYTPPDYDASQRYPLMVDLVGYTGSGMSHTNWRPFGYNLPERLDRLIASGKMGPVVAAMPDCFTTYGGNQYINSSATGPYMDFLVEEVIPFVESNFSILPGRDHRAVFGKSSGGYGALIHGMQRAGHWGAIASHSGDAYFEYAYLTDMPSLLNVLAKHDESLEKFMEHVWSHEKLSHDEGMALMMVGMAAHYDPDPEAPLGFHLPFDTHTGRVDQKRWARWLPHDPVRMVEEPASIEALLSLKGCYIDCGSKDQFNLVWGARMLHERLLALKVPHEYQEFDDDHSDVDYRMDTSLPYLYKAISAV